jgi:uncharacterized protein (DUF302 family)
MRRHSLAAPGGRAPSIPYHRFDKVILVAQRTRYGIGTTAGLPYQTAVERVREELSREGFGNLTEIDVAATLKQELDADHRPYLILGACNPPLAHPARSAERDIRLLLPCNVVVYAAEEKGRSVVTAMDPEAALCLADNPQIEASAPDVRKRL